MVESIISVAARKACRRTIFENKLLAAGYWLLAKPEARRITGIGKAKPYH
jgi:hypothetical protein